MCDNDRRSEVVALLLECLANVQTDPKSKPFTRGRALRALLHRDRTTNCIRSRRKSDHQPIAQPFNLVSAVGRDRVGEQLVMGLENALCAFVARPVKKLGRVDQIGEHQRHCAGVCHRSSRAMRQLHFFLRRF